MPVYVGSAAISKIYQGSNLIASGNHGVSQFFGGAPAAPSDPFWANVSLLLPMDGASGSTSFADASSNAFSVTSSGAEISSEQSQFGGTSAKFPTTSAYLSLNAQSAFAFGTGDWTIEFFLRSPTYANNPNIMDFRAAASNSGARIAIYVSSSRLRMYVPPSDRLISTITLAANTWYHCAFSRASGTTRLFIDGVLQASFTDSLDYTVGRGPILGNGWTLNGFGLNGGFLDEVRITKGVGRYTANFTPPTAPFPTS